MEWIIDLFDGYEHVCLFRQLMTIEFRWTVQLDANLLPCVRKFREKMGRDYDGPKGRPTVLEILATLAVECEDKIMHNDDFGNRTCQWFWMMLYNLGVNIYDDAHYTDRTAEEIDEKVIDEVYGVKSTIIKNKERKYCEYNKKNGLNPVIFYGKESVCRGFVNVILCIVIIVIVHNIYAPSSLL